MIVFPNCKINLGLRILQKRSDGYHNLETVFYPLALQDALEIVRLPNAADDLQFTTSGLQVAGDPLHNICVKAYHLLKKDFPELPPIKMHLHKVIPMGAGLGGGSADGVFALALLNKKFGLNIPQEKMLAYALHLGSDCPFFVINQPCYAKGRGELLQPVSVDLSSYQIVVVHPGIHIATAWAFSQIEPSLPEQPLYEVVQQPVATWRQHLVNDFEAAVEKSHPAIKQIKEQFYQQGAIYASMSGSGSAVYALFAKNVAPQLNFPSHYFVKTV